MEHIKMIIQEDKHFPETRQWNEFQDEIDEEIILLEKLGHQLTAQEVIIYELHCEIDKYKPRKDMCGLRIQ